MHPLALSTCWNSTRHKEGEPLLEEIRNLGFTHAELGHGLPFSRWPGIQAAVAQGVIRLTSLHNFCPQPVEFLNSSPNYVQFSDDRLSQRQTAIRHTLITVENAALLGAKAVVLHLGWAGPAHISRKLLHYYYRGGFLGREYVQAKIQAVEYRQKISGPVISRVKSCLEKIVEAAQKHGVKLGFETREGFDDFPNEPEMEALLADFPTETVGYWHDFGHSARKHYLGWHTQEETLQRLRPRLIGCHIQDCRAPERDHLPLGKGELDFPALLAHFPSDYLPVLEMSPEVKAEEIINSHKLWNSYVKS